MRIEDFRGDLDSDALEQQLTVIETVVEPKRQLATMSETTTDDLKQSLGLLRKSWSGAVKFKPELAYTGKGRCGVATKLNTRTRLNGTFVTGGVTFNGLCDPAYNH